MGDLTITVPEEYAGPITDWAKREARMTLLKDGLQEAAREIQGWCEYEVTTARLDALQGAAARINWYVDELAKLAGEDR